MCLGENLRGKERESAKKICPNVQNSSFYYYYYYFLSKGGLGFFMAKK